MRGIGSKGNGREPAFDPDSPEGRDIGASKLTQGVPSPIPGGRTHIANAATVRQRTPVPDAKPEYRGTLAHGVPPGSYTTRERADAMRGNPNHHEPLRPHYTDPNPDLPLPVPVYVVEPGQGSRPLFTLASDVFTVPVTGSAPIRIAARDATRSHILLMVETAAGTAAVVTNNQASTTTAAQASTALALPTVGEAITGFDVNFLAAAAGTSATITVTNVAGGTMSWDTGIGTGAGGTDLLIRFPNPLPASSSAVAPTVNVPAVTGGPAYSVTVYGQVTTAATSNPTGVRVDHEVANLDVGKGALIRAGGTSYLKLECNDELFAVSADASTPTLSVIFLYGVPGAG